MQEEHAAEPAKSTAPLWSTSGSLAQGREVGTATLLPNGKVLIAGGVSSTNVTIAAAEIYDPATGSVTPTGSLNVPRFFHSANLLPTGEVLIAGGKINASNQVSDAELYDPKTGVFTRTSFMNFDRERFTTTVLNDGRLLLCGDWGGTTNNCETYDADAGTWTLLPTPMLNPRGEHTAVRLLDSRVLFVGGFRADDYVFPEVETFDPATNTFADAGRLTTRRFAHRAVVLPDGRVVVLGGISTRGTDGGSLASTEIFNPSNGTWGPLTPMSVTRNQLAASLLPNGTVIAIGGVGLNSTEVLNGAAWEPPQLMPQGRRTTGVPTLLPTGELLLSSGDNNGTPIAVTELYSIDGGAWTTNGATLAAIHADFAAPLLPSGEVLIAGGAAAAEIFDPATGTVRSVGTPPGGTRVGSTATLLHDGRVLLAGGANSAATPPQLYDLTTGQWIPTGPMVTPRAHHTATLLPSGKVLVAGGITDSALPLSAAELFDPATSTWTAVQALANARYDHRAALLLTGEVLVAGGFGGASNTAERFNPVTETWSSAGTLNAIHPNPIMQLLPSGDVLVAGGCCPANATSETYSRASNSWTLAGSLPFPLSEAATAMLPSGRALVSGGLLVDGGTSSAAFTFDARTRAYTFAPSMASARRLHVLTRLPNGQLLAAGGLGGASPLALELFSLPPPNAQLRPAFTAITAVRHDGGFSFSGSGFRRPEGGGGYYLASPTDYPLLRFERADNGAVSYAWVTNWTDTGARGELPAETQPGFQLASVIVNGVSSQSRVVLVEGPPYVVVPFDAGTPDAGTPDAGTPDAGTPDAGTPDAGAPDSGVDAGVTDAGTSDAGEADAGDGDSGAGTDAGTDSDGGTTTDSGTGGGADGGGNSQPVALSVGCGCGSANGMLTLFAVIAFALTVTRRRGAASRGTCTEASERRPRRRRRSSPRSFR